MKKPNSQDYIGNPMKYFNDLAQYQRLPEYQKKGETDPQAKKMQKLANKKERLGAQNEIAKLKANLAKTRSEKRGYRQKNQPPIVNKVIGYPKRN